MLSGLVASIGRQVIKRLNSGLRNDALLELTMAYGKLVSGVEDIRILRSSVEGEEVNGFLDLVFNFAVELNRVLSGLIGPVDKRRSSSVSDPLVGVVASNRLSSNKFVVAEIVSGHVVRQLVDFASRLFVVQILSQVSFTLSVFENFNSTKSFGFYVKSFGILSLIVEPQAGSNFARVLSDLIHSGNECGWPSWFRRLSCEYYSYERNSTY
jgi:hypothetical protein